MDNTPLVRASYTADAEKGLRLSEMCRSFAANDLCIISISGIYADVMLYYFIAGRNAFELFIDFILKLVPSFREGFAKDILIEVMGFCSGLYTCKVNCTFSLWTWFSYRNRLIYGRFFRKAVFRKDFSLIKNIRIVKVKGKLPRNLQVLFRTGAKSLLGKYGQLFL